MSGSGNYHHPPGWLTRNVFNPIIALLTRRGVSLAGARVLEVRRRKSGERRQTPVNPLEVDGEWYLVAPRGETHWVRNLRVSGEGRLVGRRTVEFTAEEVPDQEKPRVLRAYLRKYKWEVGAFFAGVGPRSSDEELVPVAPDHPVFRITLGD